MVVLSQLRTEAHAPVIHSADTFANEAFGTRHSLPRALWDQACPVLLMNYFVGKHSPGPARGFRMHPHLGFESYTYVMAGELEHQDSQGHRQVLQAGDLQMIRFGRGYQHAARLTESFAQQGGRTEGFQLWINLPAAAKLSCEPDYQFVTGAQIPQLQIEAGTAQVLAGKAMGQASELKPMVPIDLLLLKLPAGSSLADLPERQQAVIFVISGEGQFGSHQQVAKAGDYLVYAPEAPLQILANSDLALLLVSCQPDRSPLVRKGPFILNTQAQIDQVFAQYADQLDGIEDA